MNPVLFPGSGSGVIVLEPDKIEIADKKYFILNFRPLNSGLRVLCRAVV